MKKSVKLLSLLLMGVCTMGFSSCSDDDDNPTEKTDEELINEQKSIAPIFTSIADTYVKTIIYPTYTDLADDCQTLYEACQTLYSKKQAGTLKQEDITAACDAFKAAREQWERSEAFLYGAASDNDIDPHIDSWPLDQDQMHTAMTDASLLAGIKSANASEYVWRNNGDFDSTLGFHGLEFVLFRDGAERTVEKYLATYDDFVDGSNDFTSVTTEDEAAFAAAVAGDLRNMTALLAYGWEGTSTTAGSGYYSLLTSQASYILDYYEYKGLAKNGQAYGAYLLSGNYHTESQGWGQTMNQILIAGCSNICSEVYQQKLGQCIRAYENPGSENPYAENPGEKNAIDYIESPYSHRSYIDYRDNIYSIKNTLYGTRNIEATTPVSNSILKYLQDNNSEMATELVSRLNAAIAALTKANDEGSFVGDVNKGDLTNAKACEAAVKELDDYFSTVGDWFASQGNK